LFGESKECNFSIDESRTHDIPQVSDVENSLLMAPYTVDEIKQDVFQMEHNKAPDLIVSELSSINVFGRSLNRTCLFYLPLSMSANSNCSA
jgi:hypothetical protein